MTPPIPPSPAGSSLLSKLTNLLVCPGEIFEEVVAGPASMATWLAPTLLAAATSLTLTWAVATQDQASALVAPLLEAGTVSAAQAEQLSGHWRGVSLVVTALGVFLGTFWSAGLLWLFARVFLKTRVAYGKAVEVAGLTSVILALGAGVTALLVAASGDAAARPALSLLLLGRWPDSRFHQVLDTLNVFHIWATAVLAIGLSKLSGVSGKEAGFWVFGYWLFFRLAVLLLG